MTSLNPRHRQIDHLIALIFSIAYLAVLLMTARDIGYARDEGFYFSAAKRYQEWFDVLAENPSVAVEEDVIERHWKHNREHPALMKMLFGFSHRLFHRTLNWMSPATAYRFPGMVAAALALYLLFIWGSLSFNRYVGFVAALSFALMPRVFYHAHVACFDMPITAMWLLVIYLYWRSLSSLKFGIGAGIAFGFSLSVKLNAFFLPFVLGVHYLTVFGFHVWKRRRIPNASTKLPAPKPWAFLSGAFLGPAIFLGHWPWLWYHTAHRLHAYLGFHSGHAHYNTAWFGENIIQAPTPILFPAVMTAITVPSIVLVLFFAGGWVRLRQHWFKWKRHPIPPGSADGRWVGDGLDMLLGIGVLFPIALISLPSVPVFGGTKHWMPAMPFICLLAGVAAGRIAEMVGNWGRQKRWAALPWLACVALLLPPLHQTATSHPFGLASYVPLIGGAPAAASMGMTRQFWGYTTAGVADWINKHAANRDVVDFHDTSRPSVRMFQTENILRRDLRMGGLKKARFALIHHELHMVRNEAWIWNAFGTIYPAHVLLYQGVPMVSVYERPKPRSTKNSD